MIPVGEIKRSAIIVDSKTEAIKNYVIFDMTGMIIDFL